MRRESPPDLSMVCSVTLSSRACVSTVEPSAVPVFLLYETKKDTPSRQMPKRTTSFSRHEPTSRNHPSMKFIAPLKHLTGPCILCMLAPMKPIMSPYSLSGVPA
eukprot:3183102-Rhodomonas_salina.2